MICGINVWQDVIKHSAPRALPHSARPNRLTFTNLPHETISPDSMWLDGRLWLLLSMAIVGPISFLKRLDSLRFTSQIALAPQSAVEPHGIRRYSLVGEMMRERDDDLRHQCLAAIAIKCFGVSISYLIIVKVSLLGRAECGKALGAECFITSCQTLISVPQWPLRARATVGRRATWNPEI
jgi:hypothetical protein